MVETEIKFNGASVWWSLSDRTPERELREGFISIGLPELIPEKIENRQALKRALQSMYPEQRALIRPLKGIVGYALVRENADGAEMEYNQEVKALLAGNLLLTDPPDYHWAPELRARYQDECGFVTAAKLGGALVKACRGLGGIPLRPRGGFYWIPEENMDRWRAVAKVAEDSHSGNTISVMRTTADEESVDAICDALIHEVETNLSQIEEKLDSGDLGERALTTQKLEVTQLDAQVRKFEKILGRTLDSLRDHVEVVEAHATMAVLAAVGG